MSEPPPYPQPPWETHGFAVFCPYAVPLGALALPDGLEPVHVAGRAAGLLAYVRYEAPSPLTYEEMIWMPAFVRHRAAGGELVRGFWVSRMWVDSEASLRAGRELWALPKTLARFERSRTGVAMHADHGTELVLEWRRLSPALPFRSRVATVQLDGDRVVSFRARTTAHTSLARLDVRRLSSSDDALRSLDEATPAGGLASMLAPFETTMLAPVVYERGG
jgi:hypothetical protein